MMTTWDELYFDTSINFQSEKKIEIASSPFRQAACTTVCVKREVLLFAFNKYTNPSPKSDLKINKLDLIIAISKNFFFQIDFQLELKEKKFEFKFGEKKILKFDLIAIAMSKVDVESLAAVS